MNNRDKISDTAFRALLDWHMASDPFPADEQTKAVIFGFINAEANKRDYEDWTEAYHEFEP